MTTKEYAKQEGITEAAALYRAKHMRGVASRVPFKMSPTGYTWDFKNGNGHAEVSHKEDSISRVAQAFPSITVSQAISIARILDGKEAK